MAEGPRPAASAPFRFLPRGFRRWMGIGRVPNLGMLGAFMATPVQKGDVLGGKFRVERVLGTGGMGVIVAAHHLQLDRLVALKFLLPEAAKDTDVVTRF